MRTALLLFICLATLPSFARAHDSAARKQIESVNQKFDTAILHMDNAAVLALWADDGVEILPKMPLLDGKKAIADFFDQTTKQLVGYHLKSNDTKFHDISISGDLAVEWGTSDQVIIDPKGKEMHQQGYIMLALRRSGSEWKLIREMWGPQ